jgi:act minimal PKS chain-length factor (CLF/KS beta)
VVGALLAMRDSVIPPTVNVTVDPEHGIDLVTTPRPGPVGTALVLARGHGGFNSALVARSVHSAGGTDLTRADSRGPVPE